MNSREWCKKRGGGDALNPEINQKYPRIAKDPVTARKTGSFCVECGVIFWNRCLFLAFV